MSAWFRRHWYDVGIVAFAAMAFGMALWGWRLDALERLLVVNLMALLCHQFEEYRLPGGAPVIINIATYGETKDFDRFPGNMLSITIVNTVAWAVYAAAIALPRVAWLGLATMLFGFTQVLGHGILMNVKTKGWYNPGLATALLLHLPIGVAYIVLITSRGLAGPGTWAAAAVGVVAIFALTVVLPVQGLKSRTTPYAIPEDLANRFHMVDKLRARGVI